MQELITLRNENSKTYELGDGKYRLESHIGAIHYRDDYADSAEAWKDIDLTWVDNRITKAPYILERGGNKLTFKDKKTGEVSTIERTSVFPPGISFEVIPELSAVRFRHTLPSSNIPFKAQFQVTGKAPITRAMDDEGELELETSLVGDVLTEKLLQVRDKRTRQVRPAKGNIRIDPTWQTGASADDCHVRGHAPSGSFYINVPYEWMMVGLSADVNYFKYGGGMRFLNVAIPQGATIDSAYLTLRCSVSMDWTVVNSRICGDDEDNCATFDTIENYQARRGTDAGGGNNDLRTTAEVDWDSIPAWIVNIDYNSPSIISVVQEIINRVGWASGNALGLFWDDHANRSTYTGQPVDRRAYSYDGSTTYAPKLVIGYTQSFPTVTTQAVTNILGITATGNGNITAIGDSAVTQHGHCWNTTGTPTTSDSKTTKGNGLVGAYTSSMTGLTPGQLYYVRAYATNSGGTSYGSEVTFTALTTPTVTTQTVTAISGTTATGNGNITSIGGSAVTQHGHCWNTTGSPTTADTKTTNGAGIAGAFTSAMTGFTEGTKYYVKAYATNTDGTSYGSEMIFWAGKGMVWPTQAITRVTGIIHRYNRAEQVYSMEVSLGEVTTDFGIPEWGEMPQTAIIAKGDVPATIKDVEKTSKQALTVEEFVLRIKEQRAMPPEFTSPKGPERPPVSVEQTGIPGGIPGALSRSPFTRVVMESPIIQNPFAQETIKAARIGWKAITPWREEKGETVASWMRGLFGGKR